VTVTGARKSVFSAIDHASVKVVGHHMAKIGDRFAGLEVIKKSIADNFGGYAGTECSLSTKAFLDSSELLRIPLMYAVMP
jgi:hypothetical protein